MKSSTALATSPNRRRFLQSAAAATAGLTIGFHWAGSSRAATQAKDVLAPNAFVRLAPDNTVTVIIKHVEMGQGTYTGLATIVAEELDADWSQVRAESAPADATRYNNLLFGQVQGTGGSTAVANSWEQLRRAGATARAGETKLCQPPAVARIIVRRQFHQSEGRLSHLAAAGL